MIAYGLIGTSLKHSFSQHYFFRKFKLEGFTDHVYINFELNSVDEITNVLHQIPELEGFNVTIPYKEKILPFLDKIDPNAEKIGAVNTVVIQRDNGIKLVGFNTDYLGFIKSIQPMLTGSERNALILGTGGASKAVKFALEYLQINSLLVSSSNKGDLDYDSITQTADIIVNATPLGTYPNIDQKPTFPYELLNGTEILYDLVYNPPVSAFLQTGKEAGCRVKNGRDMLEIQAEEAWKIWN